MPLDHDAGGRPVLPDRQYAYVVERGPVPLEEAGTNPPVEVAGKTLLDLAHDDYQDATTLQQARTLMRYVLNHYLGGQALHTRQLLRDMQQL